MIDIFQRYPFLFHKLSRNSFTKITACLQFCSFFLWMELTAEERPLFASLMNHNIDEQTNTGHHENLLKQVLCRTGERGRIQLPKTSVTMSLKTEFYFLCLNLFNIILSENLFLKHFIYITRTPSSTSESCVSYLGKIMIFPLIICINCTYNQPESI